MFSRHITLAADRHSLTLTGPHVLSHLSDSQLMSSQSGADSHVIDPAALPCMLSNFSLLCKLFWLLLFVAAGKQGCALGVQEHRGQEGFFIWREGYEEVEGSAKACCFLQKSQLNYPFSPELLLLRERWNYDDFSSWLWMAFCFGKCLDYCSTEELGTAV